jgi:hypothetical protein
LDRDAVKQAAIRQHILVQLDVIGAGIPPVYIRLAAVVDPDGRVDAAVSCEMLAQGVLVRPHNGIADADGNGLPSAALSNGCIVVELAVPRDDLGRPYIGLGPAQGPKAYRAALVPPSNHVR